MNIAHLNTDALGHCYAVYDAADYSHDEAQSWLEGNL